MDDSSPEVRNLLTALMDKAISADEQGLDRAGDREISMALFGTTLLCISFYHIILYIVMQWHTSEGDCDFFS